jgi:ATP-binding cassette subfamily B protein
MTVATAESTTANQPEHLTKEGKARALTPAIDRKDDTWDVVQRLLGYMIDGDSREDFWRAMLLRLGGIIGLIALPFFTGRAIDVLSSPEGTLAGLRTWIFFALVAGAAYMILSLMAERVFSRLATTALYRLQTDLFNHMQALSLSFFDRQPLGQLMSRVTNDTETIALFYENAVAQIIRALFQIVMIVIVMFLIEWRLALVALIIVPIMLILTAIVERISSPAFAKLQEDVGQLSGFQEETIAGAKVIIGNRRHEWASEVNELGAGEVYETASKAFFTSLLNFPITQALTMTQITLVLIAGGLMVINGDVLLGTVIAFMSYSSLLASPLSDIANLMSTTLNAVAGGRRVFNIIDEQPTVVDAPDATDFDFEGGHVVFDDVDFSYVPGRKILKHNSFEAEPGQMVGICGPTGAGKSTIINILTRYYDIDSGTVSIDDQDISQLTQASLRQQVGVVLQEAFLFSDTVMNNLLYARADATEDEVVEAAKEANAHEFIMNLPQGYETMLTERGANLSQGQRQMLTIARAMVANPKMLVLDEATSNVDTRTEKLIQEGLQRLMQGRTSFVIAHRLSTIRPAHKILVVNGGEIVEQGSHDELMEKEGFYYTLFMSQFKGKAPGDMAAGGADFVST